MSELVSEIADARVLDLGAGDCSFVQATLREVARVLEAVRAQQIRQLASRASGNACASSSTNGQAVRDGAHVGR